MLRICRKAVILIARTDQFVLGWYLARTEHSRAWGGLLPRIAPPVVVVSDGGSGFFKSAKTHWPDTAIQRCAFHAFNQIKAADTTRPRLPAGQQLYALGKKLLGVKTIDQAIAWMNDYQQWCTTWAEFLNEKSWVDQRQVYTYARLAKTRGSLNRLLQSGHLFTYLEPQFQAAEIRVPATNNLIEGETNTQLRAMLRDHRGMSLVRRIRAIFWWCYQHTPNPLPAAQILKTMPTDADVEAHYRRLHELERNRASIPGWGDAISWSELHHSAPWHNN